MIFEQGGETKEGKFGHRSSRGLGKRNPGPVGVKAGGGVDSELGPPPAQAHIPQPSLRKHPGSQLAASHPHATEQLSPCATATEPVLLNKRSHCNEKLRHSNEDPAQPRVN